MVKFGRSNARVCFAGSDQVRIFVPGLSIKMKDMFIGRFDRTALQAM